MEIHTYNTAKYPFAEHAAEQLGVTDLAKIHEGSHHDLLERKNDQGTNFHKRFYQIGASYYDLYRQFVREVIRPLFDEDLIYQKVPTFRVHLPDNVAVGEFHRDGDYKHPDFEINVWLPFTRTWDSNTMWVESEVGKEDYKPCELDYGQFMIFDGVHLKHGNHANRTGSTRISVDFRVAPKSTYHPTEDATINTGMRFKVGSYYDEME